MQQNAKKFSEQLNIYLDDLGVPNNIRERAVIFSKMIHIPKQQAWGLLEGHLTPDEELIKKIATELEIDPSLLKN